MGLYCLVGSVSRFDSSKDERHTVFYQVHAKKRDYLHMEYRRRQAEEIEEKPGISPTRGFNGIY